MMAYLSLEFADQQALEDLTRFVAVAYVFECFGCVLAAYVKEDFLSATVLTMLASFSLSLVFPSWLLLGCF